VRILPPAAMWDLETPRPGLPSPDRLPRRRDENARLIERFHSNQQESLKVPNLLKPQSIARRPHFDRHERIQITA
jgi:hypothetical protein